MSFLSVVPDAVSSAAGHLAAVGSALSEANASAAGATTGAGAMAADEVSVAVQTMFTAHAQAYQDISAQISAFHSQFVSLLNGGAASYLSSEIANAQQMLCGGTGAAATDASTTSTVTGDVDAHLPAGSTVNVAPGGATVKPGVAFTATPGYPIDFTIPTGNATNFNTSVITLTPPGGTQFTVGPFNNVSLGPGNWVLDSGTMTQTNSTSATVTVPSGSVTAGSSGADVTFNSSGLVTAINSGSVTTGATTATPYVPVAPPTPVPTNTVKVLGNFCGLTLFDTVTPTGGASITLGLRATHDLTVPVPLWAVQDLNYWASHLADLGNDLAGAPGCG